MKVLILLAVTVVSARSRESVMRWARAEPRTACPPGHTGANCETAYCQHGGEFSCECAYGYTGTYCETLIDFCNSTEIIVNGDTITVDICGLHGVCENTANGPVCNCDNGWTGPYCQVDENSCQSKPCQHSGECVEEYGAGYHCICPALYTGYNCEDLVDYCHMNIIYGNGTVLPLPLCSNHGECVDTDEGAHCECNPFWTGPFCDTQVLFNCSYKGNVYPHNSTWIDHCDRCSCEFGVTTCSQSSYCPQRCAIYQTAATQAKGIPVGCPEYENCVPDDVHCAHETPSCLDPSGWCFPVGYVMVDTLNFPTNPPNGWMPLK